MGKKNTINAVIRVLRDQQELYGDLASIEDMIDLIVKRFGKND